MSEEKDIVNSVAETAPNAGGTPAPQQLSLIDGESDEALLVPAEKAAKIYNAKTAAKLELRRNYVLDLISFGLPVEVIEEKTRTCRRIIRLLGAQYAQQVAANAQIFAGVLKAKAAKFLFLADQKAPDAKFGELMVGVGIATQRATELELASTPLDGAGTVDVAQEDPALASAREFLKQKKLAAEGVDNPEKKP